MRSFFVGLVAMVVLAIITGLVLDRAGVPTTEQSPASVRLSER